MSKENLSRRKFLHGVAAGSTAAALGTVPSSLTGPPATASSEPGGPITEVSYPISQPGEGAAPVKINIVTMSGISPEHQEKIRGLPLLNVVDKQRGY